jgi:hypothetical protein
MTPSFLDVIAKLPEAIREQILERAAIHEYCGGLSRHEAEQAALKALNKP